MRPKPSITRTVLLLAASVLALPTLAQNKPTDTGKKLLLLGRGRQAHLLGHAAAGSAGRRARGIQRA